MSYRPQYTSGLGERTASPYSLVGSIAASLGLPVEDGAAALLWTNRDAISAQLVSKWPTLEFQMQRIGQLTNRLADAAHAVANADDDEAKGFVPHVVMARAAMIRAVNSNIRSALCMITNYDPFVPEGYADDPDARVETVLPFCEGISPAVVRDMADFPMVETALARLIAIDRAAMRDALGLGKSTIRDLWQGKMEWDGMSQVWLSQQMDQLVGDLRAFVERDRIFVRAARPALVGLAWQLWPDLQGWIAETSKWIQQTPDGDPRKSWREGWEGYDPSLSPEGFE